MHLPNTGGDESSDICFSTLLYTLLMESSLQTLHPAQLQTLLREFEKIKSNLDTDGNILSEDAQATFEGTPLHSFSSAGWSAADAVAASKFWDNLAKELRPALGLRSTLPHLLINGRVSRGTGTWDAAHVSLLDLSSRGLSSSRTLTFSNCMSCANGPSRLSTC